MSEQLRDEYLDKRIEMFDGWIREGKIPVSSKIIPVKQSLSGLQWVLPSEQAREVLRNARSYALAHCDCRKRYVRCDNPTEVCFYLNDVADKKSADGLARRVSLEEAEDRLRLANEYGLIHLTIYNPEQHVYALCSCCPCCCHDIAFMKQYNRPDMVAHSDYIAVTNRELCDNCGACDSRCAFGARSMVEGEMRYDQSKCFGCGLCVTSCPCGATSMMLRRLGKPGLLGRR